MNKLSKLQKWILVAALNRSGKLEKYEDMQNFFTIPPAPAGSLQHCSSIGLGRKQYLSAHVSVSRAFRGLDERGLVLRYHGQLGNNSWAVLTTAGLAEANQIRNGYTNS
jgi:hypothetical protein